MQTKQPQPAEITGLSHEGRGIAHVKGKTVFIENALPGETVLFNYTYNKTKYAEGKMLEVLQPAAERVTPQCQHFGYCGGCSMQHLSAGAQIAFKQQVLLDQLKHFGATAPQEIMPPMIGPEWGYRSKARLGVKYVAKKGGVLVGFREKNSRYLAELERCEILHPNVGLMLPALKALIGSLEAFQHIAQLEVAVGDKDTALIFRNLRALSASDAEKLIEFAQQQQIQIYLQPKGPNSVYKLWPTDNNDLLSYELPEHAMTYYFHPLDFTQVNPIINRQMVARAIELLELKPEDNVLDLFCGLGNFSLPIARLCAHVVGVEGDELMVKRATYNAAQNDISNAKFYAANLMESITDQPWTKQTYAKILIDPPRSGALELIQQIAPFKAQRIVYVSCNPATLARDAGVLVNQWGYQLVTAGVMDMFPHTRHVESIALFCKGGQLIAPR